ncbi:MAG: response regulator transcription factor [Betaproteobacteria bacterium]|nr:response regulator transcription factor [Betaproteobacteria bacterium]
MEVQVQPIRVLLVDDHEHILWGLGKLIGGEKPRMMVAGIARTFREALAAIRERRPDVVLLDIYLGKENVIDHLPELLEGSDVRVLVLTGARDAELHQRAIASGARGVVVKGESGEVLLREIERVYRGSDARGLAS